MHHWHTKFLYDLSKAFGLEPRNQGGYIYEEGDNLIMAASPTAGYHQFFIRIEYRTMQSCSHSQTANCKECPLCRVKREVCIKPRVPALRKIARHQSQECLSPLPIKQPHIFHRKERSAYQESFHFTETNYSAWLKKMEQKRLKTQPKPKGNHPEIDWSLFGVEQHRPRFDRWERKLVVRLARSGRREELMRNMSLF